MVTTKWSPSIDDRLRRNKIMEILEFINFSELKTNENSDLMYGNTGVSIFHSYYFKLTKNESSLQKSISLAEKSLQSVIDQKIKVTNFGKGITGILWGVNHLIESDILANNIDELVDDDFFETLRVTSIADIRRGEYDYLLGDLGVALLFHDLGKDAFARPIIEELFKISIKTDNDFFWYQSPSLNTSKNEVVINLGLAHGIPGILKILSDFVSIDEILIEKSINESFNWLKRNQLDINLVYSYFPFSIAKDKEPFVAPLRWCYGDLGVAIALYMVGIKTSNHKVLDYALEIALYCLKRKPDSMNIPDAHLCHGTAGIAHIYGRLFSYTGKKVFKDASVFWFDETIKKFDDQAYSGFRAWKGDKFEWVEFSGLLEGSAGIGLALISAISEIEPKWDRSLLLS